MHFAGEFYASALRLRFVFQPSSFDVRANGDQMWGKERTRKCHVYDGIFTNEPEKKVHLRQKSRFFLFFDSLISGIKVKVLEAEKVENSKS